MLNAEGRRRDTGPSGEVESLTAKKGVQQVLREMGSRVSFSKPTDGAAAADGAKKRYGTHAHANALFFYFLLLCTILVFLPPSPRTF